MAQEVRLTQLCKKLGPHLCFPLLSRLHAAKGLYRWAERCFAALSMTGLDLAVAEELSRSFEPCLMCKIGAGRDNAE